MLGTTQKDIVTGFKGVVTGITHYLTGCSQALLVPQIKEDGSFADGHWFDVQRLQEIDAPTLVLDNGATPGCDMPAPKH